MPTHLLRSEILLTSYYWLKLTCLSGIELESNAFLLVLHIRNVCITYIDIFI